MAELRQLAIDGKRIKEAVEAVENSSAGLEITNGELTLADIPDVSLGTITDTDLQEWLAKGLPIKINNSCYIPSSITSTVVRYEHVGYTKATEPATHYLISYTYLQYTKATHSLALERTETISTEHLTAGVGIDITNNEISLDDVPIITLNTVLSDELVAWVEKGYPVKYQGLDNIEVHQQLCVIGNYIGYGVCGVGNILNGYPILESNILTYSKQDKMFVSYNTNTIMHPSSSTAGFLLLGDGSTQLVAPNVASSVANRTYPIQLDENGRAVVNVPWVRGSSKYQHNITFYRNSPNNNEFLCFSFINDVSTSYTSDSDISLALQALGFTSSSNMLTTSGQLADEQALGVYGTEHNAVNRLEGFSHYYLSGTAYTTSTVYYANDYDGINDIVIAL